jgi:hypothetical protein
LLEANATDRAERFYSQARVLAQRSRTYHAHVLQHDSLSGDNLGQQPEGTV